MRVNLFEFKLDRKPRNQYRDTMIATAVFAMFSILVSVTYVGNLLPSKVYQLMRDFLTMTSSIVIYSLMAHQFIQTTKVF